MVYVFAGILDSIIPNNPPKKSKRLVKPITMSGLTILFAA